MARRRRTRRHWPRAAASAVVIGSLVIIAMAQATVGDGVLVFDDTGFS